MKKILIRVAIALVSLIAVILIAIAIVVNLVLTPERLTPIVNDVANEFIDGTLEVERVDAVFFSSFPQAGVRLKGATLVSNAFHKNEEDTVWSVRDTLLIVDQVRVGVNIGKLLASGEIAIGNVYLENPHIRLVTDSLGTVNWDIVKSEETPDSIAVEEEEESEIALSLKKLKIDHAYVSYVDMSSKTFAIVKDLNLLVEGDINLAEGLDVDIKLDDESTYLGVDGTRYLTSLPFAIDGHVEYDMAEERYVVKKTKFTIDHTILGMDGWVSPDSSKVDMDLHFGLGTPDATQLFAYIPQDMIKKELKVSSGSVGLRGSAIGTLSKEEWPVVSLGIEVGDVKAAYEGMPYGIEDLQLKFDAMIDKQNPVDSYVNLDILRFEGGNSDLEATVKVSKALKDPTVDCTLKSHLDLPSLLEVFPIENMTATGQVNTDIAGKFRLADVKDLNLGNVELKGEVLLDSLDVKSDSLDVNLELYSRLKFDAADSLTVTGLVKNLKFNSGDTKVAVNGAILQAATLITHDSTKISPIKAGFSVRRVFFKGDSSMIVFGKHIKAGAAVQASKADPRKPRLDAGISSDTIFAKYEGMTGFIDKFSTQVMLEKVDTTWKTNNAIKFGRVKFGTPDYKLPILINNFNITHTNDMIQIDKSEVRVGHSSMKITGTVRNLYSYFKYGTRMGTKLEIAADTLNFNEILAAIVEDGEASSVVVGLADNDSSMVVNIGDGEAVETDTMSMGLIEVPKKLRVSFDLSANLFVWNKVMFHNIKSHISMQNSAMHITNFAFKQGNSDALLTMAYKVRENEKVADVKCFMKWDRAKIEELVRSIDLDTVIPALEPIKGELNCFVAAEVQVDSAWNFDLNTTRAAVHLTGKTLTVMDGETFAKISKVLMFKNKEENIIDSIGLNVLVDSGKIEILPFIAKIDRYRFVLGGSQDFDNNINYHVSIIKSPLPFKAGVNLTGTLDDMNIGITTAKLKKMDNPETQAQNDSLTLSVRTDILRKSYKMSGLDMPAQLSAE